ncbi:long-chain fatty acid--CoA ligase [Kineobactrum salinum]|uniref:Long-chain fatty acid--CoA ligase n=1 Tax=Kineobactrum salinum TaxID=2708301 RepID=A0A6C0U5F2_9GAMM|nr:long-chain fatty acid--CoA ligase [Kineobactrum salinum]QIB65625.1 long-chain fatty acid--CoA ligase [Kineobactrum salinum]
MMQQRPVNLAHILEHAARVHGYQEIVSNTVEGGLHRYTYREALSRSKQLANALAAFGVSPGDRLATLAWNGYRHFEVWYAVAGQSLVCHTLNPRLSPEQLAYIINHAGDRVIFVDLPLISLLEEIAEQLTSVEAYVVLTDREHMPESSLPNLLCYEEMLGAHRDDFVWPEIAEQTSSSLCYTSGTTGDPKGVLYSHRSNLLHAYATVGGNCFGLSNATTALMVVPMFHANSWGLVYSAPMVGAKLVLPGSRLDGSAIQQLIESEAVTFSAGVPTVWTNLLIYLKESGKGLGGLAEVAVGGAAVPRSMIAAFRKNYGVNVLHAWGMTESSPLGTINRLPAIADTWSEDERCDYACKQGQPLFGVELALAGEDGERLPHDGGTQGRLLMRGPWVIERYYGNQGTALLEDDWFDTGDIATIDTYGVMQIKDRAKDVIKSGGEWISSVDLENAAMGHSEVELAAVIAMPDPKWQERPMLIVKPLAGCKPDKDDIRNLLGQQFPAWWLPDKIEYVDDIPLTSTGKLDKKAMRQQHLAG